MSRGPESRFSQRVARKLRLAGWWYYKIADSKAGGRKPFDSMAVEPGGRAWAIEFKVGRTVVACLKKVKPHQYAGVWSVKEKGGKGVFCFGVGGETIWIGVEEVEWNDCTERFELKNVKASKWAWKEQMP